MIPEKTITEMELKQQPSFTYKMDLKKEIIEGTCDKSEAMEQSIYKIVNTERYQNAIYSWNYGIELQDLIGKESNYCICEIERRITEALLQDDRITKVYNFVFEIPKKGVIAVSFQADTTEGTVSAERTVNI